MFKAFFNDYFYNKNPVSWLTYKTLCLGIRRIFSESPYTSTFFTPSFIFHLACKYLCINSDG
jgi:hypothetical protein